LTRSPYCGYAGEFREHKTWRFRFYEVERLEYPRCHGVSPSSKKSEFVIRVRPRTMMARSVQTEHGVDECPRLFH
jgi:hypothetical protein